MAKKVRRTKRHGGRREGSGRKHKYDEPIARKSITLPESLLLWAESQPGTFSDVVVRALEAARGKVD